MATEQQLHLLHHTLGVTPKRREPYRNYFLAGEGHHDMPDLEALEVAGMMARRAAPKFCEPGDVVFYVTEQGRDYALDNLPHPPKPTKYGEYLDADTGHSFAEYLGINVPRVEMDFPMRGRTLYRYARREWWPSGTSVVGEWKPTKKEAKASYKEVLKKRRDSERAWAKQYQEKAA